MKHRANKYLEGHMTSSLAACFSPIAFWGIATSITGILLFLANVVVSGNRLPWITIAAIPVIGGLIGVPKTILNIRHWRKQQS